MKLLILFYSLYGHILQMAKEAKETAGAIQGVDVSMMRVPETLPDDVLKKMDAYDFQKSLANIPVATPDDLAAADAILFGTPTRFGNMCGQMRQFLDSTGGLWQQGKLVGKVGSVFTSSATQHGGQESTILSFHITLLHHGMVIVGLPYTYQGQMGVEAVKGGSPYGASTITEVDGSRMAQEAELKAIAFQTRHMVEIAKKLKAD